VTLVGESRLDRDRGERISRPGQTLARELDTEPSDALAHRAAVSTPEHACKMRAVHPRVGGQLVE
jgi:hypothetical protein